MDARPGALGGTGAGSLGPRLIGRLTAELILRSPQYMNCCKDYEIDLRGNKIAEIENLGATENQFDSIDLSDNAIVRLEGFPALKRLRQLLLSNNRIIRIGKNLEGAIPNLEMLVLNNNRISNLMDIDPLASLPKLKYLSLLENGVTKKPDYRLYVISRLKNLKVLDFRKIKEKLRDRSFPLDMHNSWLDDTQERVEAHAKFGDGQAIPEEQANTFEPGEGIPDDSTEVAVNGAKATGPTPEQLTAIQAAIANAQTLEEVAALEEALATGVMPSGFQNGATPMEED